MSDGWGNRLDGRLLTLALIVERGERERGMISQIELSGLDISSESVTKVS